MSGKESVSRAEKFSIALKEVVCRKSTIDEACKKSGISRSSYFRWRNMLKEYCQGRECEEFPCCVFDNIDKALSYRSKRPKKFAREVSEYKRNKILEEASSGGHSSGLSVADSLRSEGIAISTKKVISTLREEGIYNDLKKRKL